MCGRYAASARPEDLVEEFDIESDETGSGVVPRFNLAPTDQAPIVLDRVPRGDPEAAPERQLRMMRWGLVPSWSKDASAGARMINARSETLLQTAAFKRTALVRRCLVPADGWYEWQASPTATDPKGKPRKQPFFVHRADGARLAFAGLYEFWRDRERAADDPQAWVVTYTIVTAAAEPGLDRLHARMPVVLDRDRWSRWLDPSEQDRDAVLELLAPSPPGRFEAYPISTQVGSVRNDSPALLLPAPAEDLVGVVDPMTGEILG